MGLDAFLILAIVFHLASMTIGGILVSMALGDGDRYLDLLAQFHISSVTVGGADVTKNITLAIDEAVLDRVRIIAAEKKTTVNGLVRDYLENLSGAAERQARFAKRIDELRAKSKFEVGPVTWSRDDLYER